MRLPKILAVLTSPILLAGCVTAGDLSDQISQAGAKAAATVPIDPCPAAKPRLAAWATPGGNQVVSQALTQWVAKSGDNELQLGEKFIAAATDPHPTPESVALGAYAQSLGLNLRVLTLHPAVLSESGARDAEAVRSLAAFSSLSRVALTGGDVAISKGDWDQLYRAVAKTTAEDGWTADFALSLGAHLKNLNSPPSLELADKFLLAAYFQAYFRNGQVFELDFDQAKIKADLVARMKKYITDPTALAAATGDLNTIAGEFQDALCQKGQNANGQCVLLGTIGEETFVTRAGKSYGFPGITEKRAMRSKLGWAGLALAAVAVFALGGAAPALAADPAAIPLYAPGVLPAGAAPERTDNGLLHNVSAPSLTPVLPAPGKANGQAVIVAPGGGFLVLSFDNEGMAVARRLADAGVTAFVLKYRLGPTPSDPAAFKAFFGGEMGKLAALAAKGEGLPPPFPTEGLAAADAAAAVKLVRARAAEWGVDPHRVGFVGFSAGAFTAATIATGEPAGRPDFVGIIYGALRGTVPKDAPPAFIATAADDGLVKGYAAPLFQAWKAAGRPAELHIYERGGHGFGMSKQGSTSDHWFDEFLWWIQDLKPRG